MNVQDTTGRWFAIAATIAGAVLSAQDQGAGARRVSSGAIAMLATAADTDHDGAVSAQEWQAFVAGLGADEDGKLDRDRVKAKLLLPALDADRNGSLERSELAPRQPAQRPRGRGGFGEVSAADRARPPLIAWQRSLDDAWALVQTTKKPLLICVNMDGETASESLAWKRYRDPDFAALTRGFVCVLASPDRHTARDHDDQGRRLVDPRFGRLVCSEHIDIEPALYDRFFDGRRVAPRHVGVAPDGTVLFDIYLVNDLGVIDDALKAHGKVDVAMPDPASMDEAALLASPAAGVRDALEARFAASSDADRARLAGLAIVAGREVRHPELVRLALRDPVAAVRAAGAAALASAGDARELDLAREAFRVAFGDARATKALLAWLERATKSAANDDLRKQATQEHALQAGLAARSTILDVAAWSTALSRGKPPEPPAAPGERDALDEQLGDISRAHGKGDDAALDVEAARLTLRYAEATRAAGDDPTFLFDDAIAAAKRAMDAGSEDPWAPAVAASASFQIGQGDAALAFAVRALPGLIAHASSRLAMDVLALFARLRTQTIYDAMRAGNAIDAAQVSDVRAAYQVLFRHAASGEEQLAAGLDWLDVVGGWGLEAELVRDALRRFPTSPAIHERLRGQILRDEGAAALERTCTGCSRFCCDPSATAARARKWRSASCPATPRRSTGFAASRSTSRDSATRRTSSPSWRRRRTDAR